MNSALRLALAGLLALTVAMGVGRFAFTPLLPLMQVDAGLTLTGGGWLASANYLGYLFGALGAVWWRASARVLVRTGLLATGLCSLGMGLTDSFAMWWLLRLSGGVASAWVLVYGSALALERLAAMGATHWFGLVFGGVGAGIAITGLACLGLTALGQSSAAIWIVFGCASLIVSALVWNSFSETDPRSGSVASQAPSLAVKAGWGRAGWTLVIAYGVYGFGYIIPATFLPVMARDALDAIGVSSAWNGWFWPLVGLAAFASTLLAGRVRDERVMALLVAAYLVEALAVILPVILPTLAGLLLSSLLLGATFVSITMLSLRAVRGLRVRNVTGLMAALTVAFSVGQLAGPPFAAYVVEWTGGFGASLVLASAGLVLGGVALKLRVRA